ncbi:hypothetical protein BJX68DRAFT_274394 [Aspergillus pseudodeflectus]|uniref:Gylcosyl hydrolase 115 C-terminal domain-containing protein n=1 Tax=Aspergillus pseudodeflectus TaxID=176178 RepID=A0ABR4KQR3_9EURO
MIESISADGPPVNILVAPAEYKGVARAANDLALDFGRVVGVNGSVDQNSTTLSGASRTGVPIIVGTVGTALIDELVQTRKLDISRIKGKWESYVHAVVRNPVKGVSRALVIAGSDRRGTIYGIYDISEKIGVSPWYWWADVPINTKDAIYLGSGNHVQASPSVKYRGIFINDEWELMKWSENNFPKSSTGGVFTSGFHEHLFELLLRLKANYFWPGMKKYNAFYRDDPENGPRADEYGIVMGTSHHEPMTRAYYEQQKLMTGNWDWSTNKNNVAQFMEEGVERSKDWETLYTMGMRGDGDRESPTLNSTQLEEIIQHQQEMIEEYVDKPLEQVGQTWSLYKEVGKYWEAGMNVSELVTLMWTDDNFGNLLRVPTADETKRTGGAGVYYHFGYVGAPRSYEWISSNQLVKAWEQMHFAYQREAREIWIANIQDLKGWEVPMTFFLDMAYDMSSFQTVDSATDWLKRWASREFGADIADTVAEIYNLHGRLVMRRKYETLSMSPFAFSTVNYNEASNILKEWEDLLTLAQKAHDSLSHDTQGSFFELVLHPVLAGKTVMELYITKHLGDLYKTQLRTSTNSLSKKAQQAFTNDAAITSQYHALYNGKWDRVMSGPHIGYTTTNFPSRNTIPSLSWIRDSDVDDVDILGVAVQGQESDPASAGETITLRPMDPYMPPAESRYIDIFTRRNGTVAYKLETNASYVSIANQTGTLTTPGPSSDVRAVITVDWDQAPRGRSWVSLNLTQESNSSNSTDDSAQPTTSIILPLSKFSVPRKFTGHVESNEIISIEAEHYTRAESRRGVSYITLPYYGRTLSGVKLWPVTSPSESAPAGPKLVYSFFFTSNTPRNASLILFLGGSLDFDPERPMKVAFAIGDDVSTIQTKRVLPDYEPGSLPADWDTAVIRGGWNVTAEVEVGPGEQSLNLWLLEPGVVLQKIVLDFGGLEESALGPPESRYIKP